MFLSHCCSLPEGIQSTKYVSAGYSVTWQAGYDKSSCVQVMDLPVSSTAVSMRSRLRPYEEALDGASGVSSTLLIWRDTCHTVPGHAGGSNSVSEDGEDGRREVR